MAAAPTFSIVVCNYNYGRFVGEAIESCFAQTHPAGDFEIIVVDDGSTDESREILARYGDSPNLRVILQENHGHAGAIHAGATAARGRFVCLLDSDDTYLPDKLARVARRIAELEPSPDAFFLCHDVEILDVPSGKCLAQTWFDVVGVSGYGEAAAYPSLPGQFPFAIPSGQVFGRGLLLRVLDALPLSEWRTGIDSPLGHCALLTAELVHYLHEPLARYCVHGGNDGAAVVDGQYVAKTIWSARTPQLLRDLGRYVSTLAVDSRQRASRLGYVARKQRLLATSPKGAGWSEPEVDLVVLGGSDTARLQATLAACLAQSHPGTRVHVVGTAAGAPAIRAGRQAATWVAVDDRTTELERMGAGYRAGTAPFVAFIDAGDLPQPEFVERHVHAHRHGAIVAATLANARVVDPAGVALPSTLYDALGLRCERPTYLGVFASPIGARTMPPLGVHLLRRNSPLDGLFASACTSPEHSIGAAGAWLVLEWIYGLGGCLVLESELSTVPAGADGLPTVLRPTPASAGRAGGPPTGDAARLLYEVFCARAAGLLALNPPSWRMQLVQWFVRSGLAAGAMRESALRTRCEPVVAELDAASREVRRRTARAHLRTRVVAITAKPSACEPDSPVRRSPR